MTKTAISGRVLSRTLLISSMLVAASAMAFLATPKLIERQDWPVLETSIPQQIGAWQALPNPLVQVSLSTNSETDMNQPYDQTVMRSYTDNQGHMIQVAVAWGKRQRQEIKIHRPELCYPAQGLAVQSLTDVSFPLTSVSQQPVIGKRMIAKDHSGHTELVSYWIRIGNVYSSSAFQTRMHILKEGLAGHVTDGMLVRVSQRVGKDQDTEAVFDRQERFAAALVNASPPATKELLVR